MISPSMGSAGACILPYAHDLEDEQFFIQTSQRSNNSSFVNNLRYNVRFSLLFGLFIKLLRHVVCWCYFYLSVCLFLYFNLIGLLSYAGSADNRRIPGVITMPPLNQHNRLCYKVIRFAGQTKN